MKDKEIKTEGSDCPYMSSTASAKILNPTNTDTEALGLINEFTLFALNSKNNKQRTKPKTKKFKDKFDIRCEKP